MDMTKFQPARGTRDFLPAEAIQREEVLAKIRGVFERFGFDPLVTPAFESWELLSAKGGGGDAIREEIYAFKDKGERELGLRFDHTVPMARVVANNPQVAKPFKRYAIGPVWRYDRPGAGRYREFWQADVDVVGSSSALADAEIIACTRAVFAELGLDCAIRLNTRKVVEGIVAAAVIEAEKLG
ncbi:MAG TPA: ATP phosphoribosyltransferase regulatory subunit [archaeon]|nr:ATP phosphoribosyltransferase regulatory subunit [archaeon]